MYSMHAVSVFQMTSTQSPPHDLENQLVRTEIKKPAGNTDIWTYAYDLFGRRLSKDGKQYLAYFHND